MDHPPDNYEGTKVVKDLKLQRLTTSFEKIKMEEDESYDEFYAKLKDIVNSAFNFGETIPKSKIVRNVLRSLPERFYAKITTIEELKDIDKIPSTELVRNLQTYELGLTRIGKSSKSKSKSMALKAKSSDTDESSDDEDSKMKSYMDKVQDEGQEQWHGWSSWRMQMGSISTRIVGNLVLLNSRAKTKGRRMLRMAVSILFPQDQSASSVKTLVTWNKSAPHISRPLGKVRHLLLLWVTPSLRMISTMRMTKS